MNLLTFAEPITIQFRKSSGGVTMTFEAGRDYLIGNSQVDRLFKDANVNAKAYKVSRAEMRIRNFDARAAKKGDRVLIYNGSGGFGDQLLTWPVAKILADMGFDVHVLTDPGNNMCWWNFPWVKTINTIPMLWEQVKMFDHFCHYEIVSNMDEHQDQPHPVDLMLAKVGIDPASIAPERKAVRPLFTPLELGSLRGFADRKIGLYQLSSANPVRALPPSDSAYLIRKVAEAFPDTHWLCLFDEFVPPEYAKAIHCAVCEGTGIDKASPEKNAPCKECGGAKFIAKNIEPFVAPNLRELWALAEHVSVVVSPDSMMVHVAGVFGTPCVGLWGPMSPESRVAYYTNHHPIYHREFCPHSPCFVYAAVFPRYCPPRPSGRTVCDVLAGISPEEVIEAVRKARR